MRWLAYWARIKILFAILCNHINVPFVIFNQVAFAIPNHVAFVIPNQVARFSKKLHQPPDKSRHLFAGHIKVYENHLEYFALND